MFDAKMFRMLKNRHAAHSHRLFGPVRRAAAAAVVLAVSVPLAGCADAISMSDITGPMITIGIAYDRPGVALEHSGEMSGLDVDVAKYVANRLGYAEDQIVWREASNANRDELLNEGDVNMIVGVHRYLDGKADDIEFAEPYLTSGQDLLIRDSDSRIITGASDLNGRTVCIVDGYLDSTVSDWLESAGASTLEGRNYSECATALLSGTVDAVEGDDVILAGLAENVGSGSLRLLGKPIESLEYGIALPSGDSKLRDNVDDALQRMVNDGSWAQSVAWNFGDGSYQVDSLIQPNDSDD